MNWMTIAWSMCIGICCFLGLVNIFFWITDRRENVSYALAAGMSLSAVVNGFAELFVIHSLDIQKAALWLKVENFAVFGMLVCMVWLVYVRLPKARFWLANTITALWSIGFFINLYSDYSLTFLKIDSITQIATYGSVSFSLPQGSSHPFKIIVDFCSLLLLVYFIDASISSYRSGEKAKSLALGLSTATFILIGGIHSPLVDAGIVHTPYLVTFAFLSMILFMSAEMVINSVKAKRYKEQALLSNKRWQSIIDAAPLLVIECSTNGKIRYINPIAEKVLALRSADLADQSIISFIPVLQEHFHGNLKECHHPDETSAKKTFQQVELINRLHEKRMINLTIVDVQADCREPIKVLICRDVTDRLALQRDLADTRNNMERMTRVSLLGELTATLAHELNQPLATILSNAQAADRFMKSGQFSVNDLQEIIHDIIEQNRRASSILQNVRSMVENRKEVLKPVLLKPLIHSVVLLFNNEVEQGKVKLEVDLADARLETHGNPVAIQQVIMNLLVNALRASSKTNNNEPPLVKILSYPEGKNLVVAVEDEGKGIDEKIANRIFDPFITSSDVNIGLGLSISKRIAENHNGSIHAENIVNGGARFTFVLPLGSQQL